MWILTLALGVSDGGRMTDWLVSAAEMTNLVSFLSVILSFTVMFFFLVRLIGEDMVNGGGVIRAPHDPPRINFTKILLPFRIKLIGIKEPYRIEMSVTALTEGTLRTFWGVDIQSFHQVLRSPKSWFYTAFTHGNLFGQDKCIELGDITTVEKGEDRLLYLQKPSNSSLDLGPAPRDVYPCVTVLLSKESALITAIHIKDEECLVPSQILAEYYKHGETSTLLQPMYMASLDLGESSDTESQEDSDTEDQSDLLSRRRCRVARCIICQHERISRVVLPCRHATSCARCFARLENCPMCRGFIQSYFLVGKEPVDIAQSSSSAAEMPRNRSISDRLADLLSWVRGPVVLQQH